jgi:hypothetical protein
MIKYIVFRVGCVQDVFLLHINLPTITAKITIDDPRSLCAHMETVPLRITGLCWLHVTVLGLSLSDTLVQRDFLQVESD